MKFLNNIFKILKKDKYNQKIDDLIVSLTSYPDRINIVHKVIESLLNQTIKPEKIILWLADSQFPNKENDLPKELLDLRNDIFEIDWCDDIRSYKKLIPTLKKYPDKVIITCDDDVIYKNNCIELLYKAYLEDKNTIWCHRGHYIKNKKNAILPYCNWIKCVNYNKPTYNILQTGVGAVLYPSNCFYKDVLDEKLFMDIAYDTDDIWFWGMAVLNNFKIGVVRKNIATTNPIIKNDKNTLWEVNQTGRNDENIARILRKYPQIMNKLDKRLPFLLRLKKLFSFDYVNNHIVIKFLGISLKFKYKKK